MKPIAYLTPFANSSNQYIEHQKRLLAGLGFEVRPLSVAALLRGRCLGLLSARNVVCVHWLENRVFERGAAQRGVSLVGGSSFAFYLGVLALCRARVVYFVHDHAVHDVKPHYRQLSARLIALLRHVADQRVVHDPSFAGRYAASYLPHPLYFMRPSAERPEPLPASGADRPMRFVILGAIRPYKGIDRLLREWPPGVRLLIAGPGQPAYVAQLERIIRERGLAGSVRLDVRFLSEAEFASVLRAQDVLVLSHIAEASLVSGTFFEAIGVVKAILARTTPFAAWAQSRFDCVFCFEHERELPAKLAELQARWAELQSLDSARLAEAEFGWASCVEAYSRFLTPDPAAAGRLTRRPPLLPA